MKFDFVRRGLAIAERPVNNLEACEILNTLGYHPSERGPELINDVNYDRSISFTAGNLWVARPETNQLPVTLVTHKFAELCASWFDAELMGPRDWRVILELHLPQWRDPDFARKVDPYQLKLGETIARPEQNGTLGETWPIVGNVATWGKRCDDNPSFAFAFGLGFNKDISCIGTGMLRKQWVHQTSVSLSVRLVRHD